MGAKVQSCAITGLQGELVEVEVAISDGCAAFTLVGLSHAAGSASKERVCPAIMASGCSFPHKHIMINLAPADLRKEESAYDLSIAVAILLASGQITPALQQAKYLYVGELSLDGSVRHTKGVLAMVASALEQQVKAVFVPAADAREASLIQGVVIYPVETLGQLIAHLNGVRPIEPYRADPRLQEQVDQIFYEQDITAVRGQEHVKRALEVAASGGHNIVLSDPPGSGRSLLARCLPSLLPRMTIEEALDVTSMYSVSGMLPTALPLVQRPFRALHPPVSQECLLGDGSLPVPGEMGLAHRGVLFLDELPACGHREQEVLCQVLEDKVVTIAREQGTIVYPANFLLIASMRPCPCGFNADPIKGCTCSASAIARYQKRIYARLLDHIDLSIEVPRVDYEKLADRRSVETSEVVRKRVQAAREQQRLRLAGTKFSCNAEMGPAEVRDFCQTDTAGETLFKAAMQQLHLSARASHRTRKLARTIADLAESELIKANHIAEAIQYRPRMGL